jgi:hypothetical protein
LESRYAYSTSFDIIMAILLSPRSRVVEAAPLKAIVLPVIGNEVGIQLREEDLSWKVFLSSANRHPRCV